eukprot:6190610-Pleurochrysis_carterae.AAC.1
MSSTVGCLILWKQLALTRSFCLGHCSASVALNYAGLVAQHTVATPPSVTTPCPCWTSARASRIAVRSKGDLRRASAAHAALSVYEAGTCSELSRRCSLWAPIPTCLTGRRRYSATTRATRPLHVSVQTDARESAMCWRRWPMYLIRPFAHIPFEHMYSQ